ncbi:MAG: AmmeMemoRadiSam system protein A [Nitrospirota bacterium]
MHPVVELAKKAAEEHITRRRVIQPPDVLTTEMREKAGAFVSIKKHGQLRGCIGTFMPVTENVAEEIIRNAIAAATEDPRFPGIDKAEFPYLTYTVDILSSPEKVEGLGDLDPKRYGVIVVSGSRKGLLLPDLEGVDTPEQQVGIARMKAGINQSDHADIFRFEVMRYH